MTDREKEIFKAGWDARSRYEYPIDLKPMQLKDEIKKYQKQLKITNNGNAAAKPDDSGTY